MAKKYIFILCVISLITSIIMLILFFIRKTTYIEYNNMLTNVPYTLKNHFPQNSDYYQNASLRIFPYPYGKKTEDIVTYELFVSELNLEDMENEISYIEKNKIIEYKANDPKLIVVKNTGINVPKDIINRFDNLYFPIPYFDIRNNNTTLKYSKAGLSDDYEIYLFEANPGKYWDGLTPKNYMPYGWENGYSKGVCINKKEKIIIYWFVVW